MVGGLGFDRKVGDFGGELEGNKKAKEIADLGLGQTGR